MGRGTAPAGARRLLPPISGRPSTSVVVASRAPPLDTRLSSLRRARTPFTPQLREGGPLGAEIPTGPPRYGPRLRGADAYPGRSAVCPRVADAVNGPRAVLPRAFGKAGPCRRLRVPSQPSRSFGFDFNRPRCFRCDIWVVSGWQSERTGECAPRASADGEGTLSGLGGTAGRARSPGSQKRGRAAWANAERRPLCLPWMTSVGPGATPEPCGPRGHRRAAAPRIPLNRDSNIQNGGS